MTVNTSLNELKEFEDRYVRRTVEVDALRYRLKYVTEQSERVQIEKAEITESLDKVQARLQEIDRARNALHFGSNDVASNSGPLQTKQSEVSALLEEISELDNSAFAAKEEQVIVQQQLWDLIDATHQLRAQSSRPDQTLSGIEQVRAVQLLERVRQLSAAVQTATRIHKELSAETTSMREADAEAEAASQRLRLQVRNPEENFQGFILVTRFKASWLCSRFSPRRDSPQRAPGGGSVRAHHRQP